MLTPVPRCWPGRAGGGAQLPEASRTPVHAPPGSRRSQAREPLPMLLLIVTFWLVGPKFGELNARYVPFSMTFSLIEGRDTAADHHRAPGRTGDGVPDDAVVVLTGTLAVAGHRVVADGDIRMRGRAGFTAMVRCCRTWRRRLTLPQGRRRTGRCRWHSAGRAGRCVLEQVVLDEGGRPAASLTSRR